MSKVQDLQALARNEAMRAGIPADVIPTFLGLIEQESNWRPNAVGPQTRFGTAKGLGQLIDTTAKALGVKNPFDPAENLRGAARYFKQQLERFGDVGLALAAYNWGPGNVAKLTTNPRSVRVPNETQKYVPSVLKNAVKYGSTIAPSDVTMAFFPNTADLFGDSVSRMVAQKTGQASKQQIAHALKSSGALLSEQGLGGAAPMPASSEPKSPQVEPGGVGEFAPFVAAMAQGAQEAAEQPHMGVGQKATRQVKSLDDFLKARFGPLAKVADPFPTKFDKQLLDIIDRA